MSKQGEGNWLSPEARANVIREPFENITAAGFTRWRAEELALGNELTEEDRKLYDEHFAGENFADFQKMAEGATDAQLLDLREEWIERANATGLKGWQKGLGEARGGAPFDEQLAPEGAQEKVVMFGGHECVVVAERYASSGHTALALYNAWDGDRAAVATVNFPDVPLTPDQVLIKDYGEQEGMLRALEEAGVVKATGVYVPTGVGPQPVCELLIPTPDGQAHEDLTPGEAAAMEAAARSRQERDDRLGQSRLEAGLGLTEAEGITKAEQGLLRKEIAGDEALRREMWERGEKVDRPTSPKSVLGYDLAEPSPTPEPRHTRGR